MNNKILVEIEIPSIEKRYDVFIPINKKVGTIKILLEQALIELTDKAYQVAEDTNFYSKEDGEMCCFVEINPYLLKTRTGSTRKVNALPSRGRIMQGDTLELKHMRTCSPSILWIISVRYRELNAMFSSLPWKPTSISSCTSPRSALAVISMGISGFRCR